MFFFVFVWIIWCNPSFVGMVKHVFVYIQLACDIQVASFWISRLFFLVYPENWVIFVDFDEYISHALNLVHIWICLMWQQLTFYLARRAPTGQSCGIKHHFGKMFWNFFQQKGWPSKSMSFVGMCKKTQFMRDMLNMMLYPLVSRILPHQLKHYLPSGLFWRFRFMTSQNRSFRQWFFGLRRPNFGTLK